MRIAARSGAALRGALHCLKPSAVLSPFVRRSRRPRRVQRSSRPRTLSSCARIVPEPRQRVRRGEVLQKPSARMLPRRCCPRAVGIGIGKGAIRARRGTHSMVTLARVEDVHARKKRDRCPAPSADLGPSGPANASPGGAVGRVRARKSQATRRYAAPSRTTRPAVGPAKWVPINSVAVPASRPKTSWRVAVDTARS